jgi:ribonuclease Z
MCISHWHADHIAGLMGLIQTISNKDKDITIELFGPQKTSYHFDHLLKASIFDQQIGINVHDLQSEEPQTVCETSTFTISTVNLDHGVPVLGFAFQEKDRRRVNAAKVKKMGLPPGPLYAKLQAGQNIEVDGKPIKYQDVTYVVKGKKIAFITDTAFCQAAVDLAQDADLLVCEATYAHADLEKAEQYRHMTSRQAAQIASMANAKQLYLTHFSQRYSSLGVLLEDAKDVFPNSKIANDLQSITVP